MKKKKKKNKHSFIKPILLFLLVIGGMYLCNKYKEKITSFYIADSGSLPQGFTLKGIDISHYNGKIDWAKVSSDGIVFAYIKSTEGFSICNKNFKKNYTEAKKHGIVVGYYHFFLFERDGTKQAQHFLDKSQFKNGDLPPVIDVEYSPPYTTRKTNPIVVKKRIQEIHRFDSVVHQQLGIHPIIYSNKECYLDLVKGNFPENELWICDLRDRTDISTPEIEEKWRLWQYSHKGKVNGIKTKADLNVFYGNNDDFHSWLDEYYIEEKK